MYFRTCLITALMVLGGLFVPSTSTASPSIDYSVSIPDISVERFAVTATLNGISADTLRFVFPMWAPGAYDRVNFGAWIRGLSAHDRDGRALSVQHPDTNTWLISNVQSGATITYQVDDIEYLPNASWFGLSDIEDAYAFANGTALFGYPAGMKSIPYTVSYAVPSSKWSLSVPLAPIDSTGRRFRARDYDELVDSPVHMGPFQRLEFSVDGKPHVITITKRGRIDDSTSARLVAATRRIVEAMSGFFGELPYERYHFQLFLIDARRQLISRGSFGALEHAASSTYRMPWYDEGGVDMLIPVIAHEYWHTWSPKRFHSHQLGPFDYQSDPRTASLWFAEGLTEYYARVILARSGIRGPESFSDAFADAIRAAIGQPQRESMASLSRRLMSASHEEIFGIYTVGPLVGWLLDIEIRTQTRNRRSLDDVMRHFNEQYGRTGKTFGDDEIIPVIERLTGAKLATFARRYIEGAEALPVVAMLKRAGFRWVDKDSTVSSLGAALTFAGTTTYIEDIDSGGTAHVSGLRDGDRVVELTTDSGPLPIDSLLTDPESGRALFGTQRVASITVMRDGKRVVLPLTPRSTPIRVRRLEPDPAASREAREIRRGIVGF